MWSVALLLCAVLAQDEPEQVTLAERVNAAIARGVEHLRKAQRPDGHWSGHENDHPGGETALAAFTLLKSGVRRGDDAVQRARHAITSTEFKSVYSHSVRLLFFDALAQPESVRDTARASLDFLVREQVGGIWAYPWGEADLSNTQFALLGLRAAAHLELEVPQSTLASAIEALPRWGAPKGGFPYLQRVQPTAGMTAATLAGFAVLAELSRGQPALTSALKKAAPVLTDAERWLAARFDATHNAYGPRSWTPSWHFAHLWAIERHGGLSAKDKLGEHDWYTAGATWLVDEQRNDGAWGAALDDTCFALLFLRRATTTVIEGDLAAADVARVARARPIEPAAELAYLTDFLLAGPWKSEESGLALIEPPFDPRKARARLGDKLARREWQRIALKPNGWTNLEELLENERGEHELYALAATVAWDGAEALEASLWLHLEDGWDAYFDGERVSFGQRVQAAIDGRVRADLRIEPGEHLLLVLVEEETGSLPFAARISARDGQPLPRAPRVWAVAPKASKR